MPTSLAEERAEQGRWALRPEWEHPGRPELPLENEFLSEDEQHARQAEALRQLVQFCAAEVPFYRVTEQTAIVKLLIFVHKDGQFIAADQYYAKSDRDESFLLWYRFQRTDDVREGWDRAELRQNAPPPAAR